MIWRSSSKPRCHLVSARSDTCFFRMLWTRRRLIQLAIHCCGEEVLAAIVSEVLAAIWRRHCRATIVQVLAERAVCTELVMDAF